jgi:starch phosphorylase
MMPGTETKTHAPAVAYFSMEIALESDIPTYSGGLGVLAGDTVRAAADLGIPMVAVTLAYREGHFVQRLDASGTQVTLPDPWLPEARTEQMTPQVRVEIEGRPVTIRAWRYCVQGVGGASVPVFLLDTNLHENAAQDRGLTDDLYGGDQRYRLAQEAVLGLGGVRMLEALGLASTLRVYHMNEGHCALAPLAIARRFAGASVGLPEAVQTQRDAVRDRFVFTTHTPVADGHDRFPLELVGDVLGPEYAAALSDPSFVENGAVNMTRLGLHFSRFASGVSMRHGQISRAMFPEHHIATITNGVDAGRWVSPPFAALYDEFIPHWRAENLGLRDAMVLPEPRIIDAHNQAKARLLEGVAAHAGAHLNPGIFTIGFARRATGYKRAAMLLSDLDRLRRIAIEVGPLQVLYAGKAHPRDTQGQDVIRQIFAAAEALRGTVPVVYLQDYDMARAADLVSGVDLWLNTPEQPLEASGTSGMKAALNGVPSLSVLDGWWIEGHVEGVTGWSIRDRWQDTPDTPAEADSLYRKLGERILPLYYGDRDAYARVMRGAIALNGSFFNAQRMVRQYEANAYLL